MSVYVDIKKNFGPFVLDVQVEAENETLALLGASGCGKSMTLKCIAGIERPDSGQIAINGTIVFDAKKGINLSPQQRKTGYLFQNYALFPNMTAHENIACAVKRPKHERAAVADRWLDSFYLDELKSRYPHQLSGGQQQRVALARMLASEPDILMLDEPFSALDSYLRWQMEQELRGVLEQFGGTALYISHNRDEVYRLCDRIAVISDGRVSAVGEKWALFDCPGVLSACLLTGCKNISPAKRVGAATLDALQWGLRLKTTREIPDDVAHVGVRAHTLTYAQSLSEPNAFTCRITQVIEDTFTVIVMIEPLTAAHKGTGSLLRLEVPKNEWSPDGSTLLLKIPPENVLPLTNG